MERNITVGAGERYDAALTLSGEEKLNIALAADASAKIVIIQANTSASCDIKASLNGEGAQLTLAGLYVARQGNSITNNVCVTHNAPHGTSRQLFKGICDGDGQASFTGRVVVKPGAQKTDATQTNRNMLLSPQARAASKPELEIYADDVKCGHGSSTGQLDPEQMFYMVQRGIPQEEARRLLIAAYANEVIDMITDEGEREKVRAALGL